MFIIFYLLCMWSEGEGAHRGAESLPIIPNRDFLFLNHS